MIEADWKAHELIWLEAAMEMVGQERIFAFRDIAQMTGRTVIDLENKANGILAVRRAGRALLDWARNQVRHVPGPAAGRARNFVPAPMAPSQISPIPMARLMGGRA